MGVEVVVTVAIVGAGAEAGVAEEVGVVVAVDGVVAIATGVAAEAAPAGGIAKIARTGTAKPLQHHPSNAPEQNWPTTWSRRSWTKIPTHSKNIHNECILCMKTKNHCY